MAYRGEGGGAYGGIIPPLPSNKCHFYKFLHYLKNLQEYLKWNVATILYTSLVIITENLYMYIYIRIIRIDFISFSFLTRKICYFMFKWIIRIYARYKLMISIVILFPNQHFLVTFSSYIKNMFNKFFFWIC